MIGRDGVDRGRPRQRTFAAIPGDDKPFDPSLLLALNKPTVLWGANHCSHRVPGSSCWLHWDKREDSGPDDGADFEHVWRGTCRASETGVQHLYATQKPVALMVWVSGMGWRS